MIHTQAGTCFRPVSGFSNRVELLKDTDAVYQSLPDSMKDAFFQMVVYNVRGAGLQNRKAICAQKSAAYGKQGRSSTAIYSSMAQQAENEIYASSVRHARCLLKRISECDKNVTCTVS